jgi:chorismate mutase
MERITLAEDVTAALERARIQVEALAETAEELQNVLPETVGIALTEGLRTEAAPLARRLAEVKGLTNGTIRRLERLETDLLAERHARVDDLALLVDLVTGGWRAINERLDAIEASIAPRERTRADLRAAEAV